MNEAQKEQEKKQSQEEKETQNPAAEVIEVETLPEAAEEEREEVTFRIYHHYGVMGVDRNGWEKELNLVSWNDRPARYDIRCWDHAHTRMTRGITLSKGETVRLKEILLQMEFPQEGSAVLLTEEGKTA